MLSVPEPQDCEAVNEAAAAAAAAPAALQPEAAPAEEVAARGPAAEAAQLQALARPMVGEAPASVAELCAAGVLNDREETARLEVAFVHEPGRTHWESAALRTPVEQLVRWDLHHVVSALSAAAPGERLGTAFGKELMNALSERGLGGHRVDAGLFYRRGMWAGQSLFYLHDYFSPDDGDWYPTEYVVRWSGEYSEQRSRAFIGSWVLTVTLPRYAALPAGPVTTEEELIAFCPVPRAHPFPRAPAPNVRSSVVRKWQQQRAHAGACVWCFLACMARKGLNADVTTALGKAAAEALLPAPPPLEQILVNGSAWYGVGADRSEPIRLWREGHEPGAFEAKEEPFGEFGEFGERRVRNSPLSAALHTCMCSLQNTRNWYADYIGTGDPMTDEDSVDSLIDDMASGSRAVVDDLASTLLSSENVARFLHTMSCVLNDASCPPALQSQLTPFGAGVPVLAALGKEARSRNHLRELLTVIQRLLVEEASHE